MKYQELPANGDEFKGKQNINFEYLAATSTSQVTDANLGGTYVLQIQDQPNFISDGDGNNTIYGGRNNDTVTSGNGANLIYEGSGNDSITTGNRQQHNQRRRR